MSGPRAAASDRTVRLTRSLEASPDEVYRAWLDPAILAQWISPVGHAIVSVDPRPGGRFRVVMVGEGREIEHVGRYRDLVPGRRLVFTWRSPFTGGDSLVSVELEPAGRGTTLRLVHEGLPGSQVGPHAGGWGAILDRLAATVARSEDAGQARRD